MKHFIIACTFFLIASLGAIFGLTVLLGKVLVPPSAFDIFVSNYLGNQGALMVIISAYALGVGMVFIVTRKLLIPRLARRSA